MKYCTSCEQTRPLSDYDLTKQNIPFRRCRECREHYQATVKLVENGEFKSIQAARIMENKLYAYTYLANNPCIDCGEKDPIVLEFDHIDPTTKKDNVGEMICKQYKLLKIKQEIAKCEVRCANCHRRKTAIQFNFPKLRLIHTT